MALSTCLFLASCFFHGQTHTGHALLEFTLKEIEFTACLCLNDGVCCFVVFFCCLLPSGANSRINTRKSYQQVTKRCNQPLENLERVARAEKEEKTKILNFDSKVSQKFYYNSKLKINYHRSMTHRCSSLRLPGAFCLVVRRRDFCSSVQRNSSASNV